jgi:hypothetical protein
MSVFAIVADWKSDLDLCLTRIQIFVRRSYTGHVCSKIWYCIPLLNESGSMQILFRITSFLQGEGTLLPSLPLSLSQVV